MMVGNAILRTPLSSKKILLAKLFKRTDYASRSSCASCALSVSATGTSGASGTAYDLLVNNEKISKVIKKTEQGDIIPAGGGLAKLDVEMSSTGKEYKLKEALKIVLHKYSHIIIDTPPALGLLTINALTASNSLVIPAQADIYSLQGMS